MPIIEDGKGRGFQAEVSSGQKLKVEAVTKTAERHANEDEGEAYNLLFQQTPAGAGNCFIYIKNTHSSKNLIVEGIWIRSAGNERIDVYRGRSGDPVGGTSIVPQNCNVLSGNEAQGTFEGGNNITGLTAGDLLERIYVATGNESNHFNFEQDIIIPVNGVLTLEAEVGSIEIDGTLVFNYHEVD